MDLPPLDVVEALDALALAFEVKPNVSGPYMRFRTQMDDRVCPICAPLNGRLWAYDSPGTWDVPPIHVNCRCDLEFEEWQVLEPERLVVPWEKSRVTKIEVV